MEEWRHGERGLSFLLEAVPIFTRRRCLLLSRISTRPGMGPISTASLMSLTRHGMDGQQGVVVRTSRTAHFESVPRVSHV